MGLRTRLWLVVGALALLPLLVGGVIAVALVDRSTSARIHRQLTDESSSIVALFAAHCQANAVVARAVGVRATTGSAQEAADYVSDVSSVSYAALLRADGSVLAQSGRRPGDVARLGSCAAGQTGPSISERVQFTEATHDGATAALAATAVDSRLLTRISGDLALSSDTKIAVLQSDGAPLASTAEPSVTATLVHAVVTRQHDTFGIGSWAARVVPPGSGHPFLIVVAIQRVTTHQLLLALAGGLVVVAAVGLTLGWRLARRLTRPLAELTAAAERVAAGDLEQTLPVRSNDETGRLAAAFNEMTYELQTSMSALERSRDDLRDSLQRLGGALGSTHNVAGLLQAVLDSAVTVTGAQGGAAWTAEGTGPFRLVASSGPTDGRPERVAPAPVRVDEAGVGPESAGASSAVRHDDGSVVVSLQHGRVAGLLQLDVEPGRPLAPDTDDALRALAAQASIAVDNVLLHQEAQQLSNTDPLTGLGNFRYLSSNLAREIERATRFGRPLAVLMLDLDHFKSVNDTYGHPRGDTVLRELAARMNEQVREVDTAARYGGEEFVLVLPETDIDGATRLAERICLAVRREPFRDESDEGQEDIRLTVSVGVAAFPQHGASPATLMRTADAALYEAKTGGRDGWRVAKG